jgi:tetratricopeptide (TPR) repeat protein
MLTHSDVLAASGTCSAHTGPGDPYLPIREILQLLTGDIEARRASGSITPDHARRLWDSLPDTLQSLVEHGPDLIGSFVSAEKLALRAEAVTSASNSWRERLAELIKRAHTAPQPADVLTQFTAVLSAVAQTRTLILVLDDLQWADDATLNWLFHVGRHLSGIRCLIIGAYRPADIALGRAGQRHPLEAVLNELRRNLGDIQVNLDRSAGRAFIDALLDAEPNDLPVQFRDTLYQHTGGNALFTVELISDLKMRGELTRDDQNRWVAGAALNWDQLPVRVDAVIAERINRVPEQWQALLEAACVAGDEFTTEVVAEAIGLETAAVIQALGGELNQRYQLITPTRLERLGTKRLTHFRFRHNLFEKYLYQRLNEVRRTQLHEAIGTALEHQYADRPADLQVIAPHLARQFEAAGLTLKAGDYWRLAGQRAVRLAAYPEAITLLTHGLRLLNELPDSAERAHGELNLQLALGAALLAQGWGTADRARVFDRAFELALQTGTVHDFLHTLFSLAQQAQAQGDIARALAYGLEMLRSAGKARLRLQQAMAQNVVGTNYCIAGHFATACAHLERALALVEAEPDEALLGQMGIDLRTNCLAWLLVARWVQGEADRAEAHYQQVLQRAQQIDHPVSLAAALTLGICPWLLDQKELTKAAQHLVTLRHLAEAYVPLFQPWDKVFTGYVRVCQGDRAGLAQLQQGIVDWTATGTRGGYVHQHLLLMEACLQAGEIERGLQTAAEVVAQIEQHDWRMYEAEVRRVQGELWRARGDQAQAWACFEAALAVARAQGARLWEERAVRSLEELSRPPEN